MSCAYRGSVGPLPFFIDNLLSMRSCRNSQSLEEFAHLFAKVEVMVVDGIVLGRWTAGYPLSGQNRLQHFVPENPYSNHCLQSFGRGLVAAAFARSVKQLLAAQLA